jgi:hypothetical protein
LGNGVVFGYVDGSSQFVKPASINRHLLNLSDFKWEHNKLEILILRKGPFLTGCEISRPVFARPDQTGYHPIKPFRMTVAK